MQIVRLFFPRSLGIFLGRLEKNASTAFCNTILMHEILKASWGTV